AWSQSYYDEDSESEFTNRRRPARSSSGSSQQYGSQDRPQYDRRWSGDELGSKIKKKVWDQTNLPPLEKNFYVEHPSVAQKTEAEINSFYKQHNIIVKRGQRPIPVSHFHEANFPEEINKQLEKNGWAQPTPIQSLGWPLALSGKNMVGIAQTGSGKTLGFILPGLVHIKNQARSTKGEGPIVLVIAPTRELAQQIKSVAIEYGRVLGIKSCCLFGGQSKSVQASYISEGPEIVVATPGRLLDFMDMGVINLDRTSYVVLDEADRMLDMGFEPQIRKALQPLRPDRQMLMWSATWPQDIQQLAHDFLGEFTQVNIGSVNLMANPNILQKVHVCERREKLNLLINELELASADGKQKTLIFAQTKMQADFLTQMLQKRMFKAVAIHGDKSQVVRDRTLQSFKKGEVDILVATDVASRGLDVNDIKLVINYDYPNNADDYIHRIGRTGRASKTGTAVTFVTSEDTGKMGELITVLKDSKQTVPQELLEMAERESRFNTRGFSDQYRKPQRSGYSNEYRKPYRPDFNRRNSW
ncbi:unnamed protein product, partial [Candidula unifasciata]